MEIIRAKDFKPEKAHEIPPEIIDRVREILNDVKARGDEALIEFTEKFDHVRLDKISINPLDIEVEIPDDDRKVIEGVMENITNVARAQKASLTNFVMEVVPGVRVRQRITPIERVGIYVPGGRYPLISTLMMCGVPASVAGVNEIYVATPPSHDGGVNPYILYVARLLGVKSVFLVGGAQAIAALAFGTESVPRVDKVVGPGNIYTAVAKKEVSGQVGIDFIAGPTEVLIIADEMADPEILAHDLLAQAEHDVYARPMLISNSREVLEKTIKTVEKIIKETGNEVARESIERNGAFILAESIEEAIEIAKEVAPEHLELQVKFPDRYVEMVDNFGTLFVGELSAEALGDYSAGVNHVLPTNGSARFTGGLHVKDFLKIQSILEVHPEGFEKIAPLAVRLAELESLTFHAQSVKVREKKLKESR